jgi:exodeoxyribonuclease V beta subunit
MIQNRQAEGVRDIPGIRLWMNNQREKTSPEGREDAVRLDTEDAAVRVMTMHTAKGLEFPLVFLLGGFSGKSRRKNDGDYRFDKNGSLVVDRVRRESNRRAHLAHEWEEDKRLWYVAFTRASVKLWIALPSKGCVTQVESLVDTAFRGGDSTSPESFEPDLLPPHQMVPDKEAGIFRAGLETALEARAAESPVLFSFSPVPDSISAPLKNTEMPKLTLAALPSDRVSGRDPVTSSYTSLVKFAAGGMPGDSDENDDRDVDGMGVPDPALPAAGTGTEPLPLAADRGALFGTLVHSLLENCDYRKAGDLDEDSWYGDADTEALFQSHSRRCYPPDWYRSRSVALKALVRSALRCEIPGLGRLCDIEPGDMRPEVEFHMSVPRSSELISEQLRTSLGKGFLKGFIDLLLKSGDRWWVVDWKTNVPPGIESAESYSPDTLKEIMNLHHYHLQYELYLLALCRTLSGNLRRPVKWDREIGGAAYLFVRGTRDGDDRGVSVNKPSLSRMLGLASEMGLEGVLE